MKGWPSERQAALAARQLHYHREKLRWIQDRMQDNEALLLLYLVRLDADATVLPGGYKVEGRASTSREVGVEKLAPESPYEQLVLPVDEWEVGRTRTTPVAHLSGDPAHGCESPESPRKEIPA